MLHALDLSGDVSSAGAALAGLLLVFIGSTTSAFDSYEKQSQKTVRRKYQFRAWGAFGGFFFALLSSFLALVAKWRVDDMLAVLAISALFLSFVIVTFAAIRAVLDVK